MKLGEISENDTYQELLNKRGDFSDFFLQHIQDGSEEVENLDYVIIHLEGNLQSEELKEQKFVSVVTKNPLAICFIHPILVKQKCLETVDKENIKDSKSYSSELLDGVNDIDEDDSENLLLASEYVNDIYDYLFQLEFEQPIVKNHLEGQVGVNVNMRPVLIDEINEVHLQFRLIPETFQMVVAIIERCLQAVTGTKRSQLQLVGVTGLFVAVKYEELFPPPIANFVYITHESYTDSQIRKMELKMIET
ncbi:G2/mitotic-specific cyclin-B-like [Glossina fuscipes fuscipes]